MNFILLFKFIKSGFSIYAFQFDVIQHRFLLAPFGELLKAKVLPIHPSTISPYNYVPLTPATLSNFLFQSSLLAVSGPVDCSRD